MYFLSGCLVRDSLFLFSNGNVNSPLFSAFSANCISCKKALSFADCPKGQSAAIFALRASDIRFCVRYVPSARDMFASRMRANIISHRAKRDISHLRREYIAFCCQAKHIARSTFGIQTSCLYRYATKTPAEARITSLFQPVHINCPSEYVSFEKAFLHIRYRRLMRLVYVETSCALLTVKTVVILVNLSSICFIGYIPLSSAISGISILYEPSVIPLIS